MNLEALVSKLDGSVNREFADKVFSELDRLDAKYASMISLKDSFKEKEASECAPIIAKMETLKALNIGFRKDHKAYIRDLKNEAKARIKVLTKDYKIEVKQLNQDISKIEEKLQKYYLHHKKGFLKAIKHKKEGAKAKLDIFEREFADFKNDKIQEVKDANSKNLEQISQKYNENVSLIEKDLNNKLTDAINLHNEKVNGQYVLNNRKQIKEYKNEISKIKKKARAYKLSQKANIKKEVKEYKALAKEVKANIKKINIDKQNYVKSLPTKEANEFNQLEKLIRQEVRSRRAATFQAKFKKKTKHINAAYFFVAPAFLGALVMTIMPFIFMLITAWFKLDLVNLGNSEFVGFKNFKMIFLYDTEFQKSLVNTALYAFFTFGLLTVVTVLMAAWLSKNTRIHNVAQTMVFTPHIASLVAVSIVWIALLNPNGIINQVLAVFGIKGPGWLIQENTALLSVSFVQVWKDIGYYVLIIISGLQGIPSYVYEAAKLDKASKATTFFKITIPLLLPTLSFVFITKFINSFKVFAPIEIMTNGGPMGSSMVLSYWIYKVGRIGYNYGFAMAGAIILTLVVGTCTIINHKIFNVNPKKK